MSCVLRGCNHVNIIPPAWGGSSNPLPFLRIPKQIRELKPCIGPRVVSTNKDALVILFIVLDVAEAACDSLKEVTLQLRTHRDLKRCVLKTKRHAVFIWDANKSPQGLVHKHLPHAGEHLTPTSLAVPDVPLIVNVIGSTMGHDLVVSATEIPLVQSAEEIALMVRLRTPRNVRLNRVSPGGDHLIDWEGPVSVKPRMVSRIPSL